MARKRPLVVFSDRTTPVEPGGPILSYRERTSESADRNDKRAESTYSWQNRLGVPKAGAEFTKGDKNGWPQ